MGLFDFFNIDKKENREIITNSLGVFQFLSINGLAHCQGKVRSKTNNGIEILFPIKSDGVSPYQIEYFERIENSWISIWNQISTNKKSIKLTDYSVVRMLIPDKENEHYDIDAEIVLQKDGNIISLIMKDLNIEEIMEVENICN